MISVTVQGAGVRYRTIILVPINSDRYQKYGSNELIYTECILTIN